MDTLQLTASVTYDSFANALGMYGTTGAGNVMGGLHYQRWFNRFGVQFTAGGMYNPEATFETTLDYSALLDGLWTVYGNTFSNFLSGRLYLWGEIGHHGFLPAKYNYDEKTGSQTIKTDPFAANGIAGFGIGIETILFEHFSFPVKPVLAFSVGGGIRYRY